VGAIGNVQNWNNTMPIENNYVGQFSLKRWA